MMSLKETFLRTSVSGILRESVTGGGVSDYSWTLTSPMAQSSPFSIRLPLLLSILSLSSRASGLGGAKSLAFTVYSRPSGYL